MKIDSDLAIPATPERQQPAAEPASEPRSSRVTINVRTPSQALEVIPSSPPSPSPIHRRRTPPSAAFQTHAVNMTAEEAESAMPVNGTTSDAAVSSRSDSGSPPIEIVSVAVEDDADFDDDDSITMLDESGRSLDYDPSASFPFHDTTESYMETVIRLLQFLPTHEQVPRAFIEWIDKYLGYVKTAPLHAVEDSTFMHRDMWQAVPHLVLHMVTRKAYPRSRDMRHEIFAFFRSFAQLTVFFVEMDLRVLRSQTLSDEARIQALASPSYIHALGALTRREEVSIHSSPLPRNGDDDWSYVAEMIAIVDTFQNFPAIQGGSLSHIQQLATLELRLASQFPRLITDHLGNICLVAGNIMKYTFRRAQYPPNQQVSEPTKGAVARMYPFFTTIADMLSDMVDKNLNQLSPEGAANLIEGLTEVYQTCVAADGVVPSDVIDQHLQGHPPVAAHLVPEAIAYHWKFTHFVKLIRSGQMQLRVMAVSTMCSDLVALYRKSADPLGEEATLALLHYVADFLLSTGLVNYILGPTCHPEITLESSNIIGFLVVSATYSRAHTDTLWQTVTSTQDPRVSDALIRMIGRITNLFTQESLMYFLEKLNTIPVEVFSSTMREFCDQVLKQILTRFPESLLTDSAPFDLFIRLIRQSSGLGPQSPVAYPDLQQFAIQKFDSVLNHGPDQEGRWKIYRDCLSDIAQRSPSTIGSLWVLKMATRFHHARDLHELASEHDLTKLLIEELAAAVSAAKAAGFSAAISGAQNAPRKELLTSLIYQESTTITGELGPKLWDLLVGSEAACQEDRDAAWQILTIAMKRSLGRNPFASICFAEYLLTLDPKLFCQGALDFVREGVIPLVNDPTSIVLDDEENPINIGIEMLWRISLTAPTGTVERRAIHALVSDVYIESRSIRSFQRYRARKVHLALVDRCLGQLSSAAARLKTFADGTTSGDDDSMVIIATDRQIQEQELSFVRSLAVLREFHRAHRAKSEFSAPDMRSLILESPKEMEGESAELKYQSFDGDKQTTVMPLVIGKLNTGADLLAKLREVAGFECFQIYYRGRPFVPQESDLCKSLEDLQIHNGILLVKREPEAPTSPRVPQGASPVEVEILNHFDELWEYLSIDEKLAREMYGFLVKLPRDKKLLEAISDPSVSYLDIFPIGQPFKSLYAVDALQEYLGSSRPRSAVVGEPSRTDDDRSPRLASLARAMSLVVPAISDPQLVAQCPNQELQIELGSALIALFVSLLRDPDLPASATQFLDPPLLGRLLAILSVATPSDPQKGAIKHISLCLQSILESCCVSDGFLSAFVAHPDVPHILEDLLLSDLRATVRRTTAVLIREKTGAVAESESCFEKRSTTVAKLREFLWPLISRLVRPAIASTGNSAEILELCSDMLGTLEERQIGILDLKQLSTDWFDLLVDYNTTEVRSMFCSAHLATSL
jgi:ubiquitin carboxyl-terminal hydrolase 34